MLKKLDKNTDFNVDFDRIQVFYPIHQILKFVGALCHAGAGPAFK